MGSTLVQFALHLDAWRHQNILIYLAVMRLRLLHDTPFDVMKTKWAAEDVKFSYDTVTLV